MGSYYNNYTYEVIISFKLYIQRNNTCCAIVLVHIQSLHCGYQYTGNTVIIAGTFGG